MSEYMGPWTKYVGSVFGDGWEVVTATKDRAEAISSLPYGLCIDGRPIKGFFAPKAKMLGPRLPGGVLYPAVEIATRAGNEYVTKDDFRRACSVVRDTGVLPAMHDVVPRKCAHLGLVENRAYSGGVAGWNLSNQAVLGILQEFGGDIVELEGQHNEDYLAVVARPNVTLIPDYTCFTFSLHYLRNSLGFDADRGLNHFKDAISMIHNHPTKVVVFE